jgi:hypothetical protein
LDAKPKPKTPTNPQPSLKKLVPSVAVTPEPADCQVRPEHLAMLSTLHELLTALNDAWAGRNRIVQLVSAMPVLGMRCIRRALRKRPTALALSLDQTLTMLGNRDLEAELLELLEDLTIMKAELEPPPP